MGGIMRALIACAVAGLTTLSGIACGGAANPASPSTSAAAVSQSSSGTARATPIGLTGVIRGLDLQDESFSLATRTATYVIRIDSDTQVWNRGTQVRPATLRDGTAVSIRGYDYARYVLARTISIN
jgi:hypothetical protein